MGPRAFGIGPANHDEFLAVQAFDLGPQTTIAGGIRRIGPLGDPSHTTGHTGHVPGGSTGLSWDTDMGSGPEPGFGVLASPRLVRSLGSRRPEFHPGAPVPRPVNTGSSAAFHS